MPQLPLVVGVVLFALLGPAQGARAAAEPLLVVVEAEPGADVAPAEIRAVLREELKTPILSPKDAKASDATRLLVVTLDGPAIRVSLRESQSELVTRTVGAPSGQSARLRTIAWLAGNLARDQVTKIVDGPVPGRTAVDTAPGASGSAPASAGLQPAATPQPLQPPPPTSVATSTAVDSVAVTPSSATSNRASEWAVTVSAGPLLVPFPAGASIAGSNISIAGLGSAYELRVQRSESHGLNLSLAVEIGQPLPHYDLPFFGVAGLAGKHWDHRHWFAELAAGVGVEVAKGRTETTRTTASSVSGFESTLVTTYEERPGLFATGRGALGLPLSPSLDALAELGVLVGSLGYQTDFLSTTLGLRLRIP
jgi:hypothetical protein